MSCGKLTLTQEGNLYSQTHSHLLFNVIFRTLLDFIIKEHFKSIAMNDPDKYVVCISVSLLCLVVIQSYFRLSDQLDYTSLGFRCFSLEW